MSFQGFSVSFLGPMAYGFTLHIFNKPGEAGAVLQTPPSLINILSQPQSEPDCCDYIHQC